MSQASVHLCIWCSAIVVGRPDGQDLPDERLSYFLMLLQMQIGVVQQFGCAIEVKSMAQFVQGMTNAHLVYRFLAEGFEEYRI